jgi:1-acyl-sn-glycerol-3-phosphate acyltransferase
LGRPRHDQAGLCHSIEGYDAYVAADPGSEPASLAAEPLTLRATLPSLAGTAVAAFRSVLTFVAISLYVLLVAPPGLFLAVVFRWKGLLYILGHIGIRLGLLLSGIGFRVSGREHVPADRAVVFCANHQSNIDPPVLFEALHPRLHILYKAELSKLPLLGRAMQVGGFVPVERHNREQAFASIARGAESLRAGHSFLIFPEGTRSRTEALLPFKKGGFIMAIQAQVPIVPVAVTGGRAAMRKGSPVVRPVTIQVRIGPAVETEGLTLDDRDRVVAAVRSRVEALLTGGEHPVPNERVPGVLDS